MRLSVVCRVVEVDDDMELMAAAAADTGPGESTVSVETQLSSYLQLQMQMFRSVVTSSHRADDGDGEDDGHVHDLVDRFGTLQDRQMKLIDAIQQSRYAAEQVRAIHCPVLVRQYWAVTAQRPSCDVCLNAKGWSTLHTVA